MYKKYVLSFANVLSGLVLLVGGCNIDYSAAANASCDLVSKINFAGILSCKERAKREAERREEYERLHSLMEEYDGKLLPIAPIN